MARAAVAANPILKPSAPEYGDTEPRVFTPPLRELTPETSLGYQVIDFAENIIGIELLPYQRWLFVHALETLPDGNLRFKVLVVLIARQNGKSTWSQILALFFMYVLGCQLVIGTAQDLDVAEEIWQGAVEIVEGNEELNALKERVVRAAGKKSLDLKTGERWKVKAANRRAGRGLSGDLVILDELREQQSWDAWGAVTKTTMARPHALIVALSNAGDATSIVLRYLRKMAHAALGDPDGINAKDDPSRGAERPWDDADAEVEDIPVDDTLGIFEWSGAPDCSMYDRKAWAAANPAKGRTIQERTIASASRTDPEWVFRTEVLCQWSDGSLEGPFPSGTWEDCTDAASEIVGPVWAGVDMAVDSSRVHIAFAGYRADGLVHVEVVASRPGIDWVGPWLAEPRRAELIQQVVVAAKNAPIAPYVADLETAGVAVVPWEGADIPAAVAALYGAVRDRELRHLRQPLLDVAASTAATRPAGDGLWVWDRRRSPVDVAPLVAATAATWPLLRPQPSTTSVYESRGLLLL